MKTFIVQFEDLKTKKVTATDFLVNNGCAKFYHGDNLAHYYGRVIAVYIEEEDE